MNTDGQKVHEDLKESYVKPEIIIIKLELENTVLASSYPTGSGEDMPWGR